MSAEACNDASATSGSAATPAAYQYNLAQFLLSDVVRCGYFIRHMADDARRMEDVVQRVVDHLFATCRNSETGEHDLALVRFFKSHDFGDLDESLQCAARAIAPEAEYTDRTKCLVLLATAGLEPEWNDRRQSSGHRAIPLLSEIAVGQIPMIAQLIHQFGLELSSVVDPAPELLCDLDQRNYNAFHVEQAVGSPFIPAQDDFVKPYGIRSVVGFGGMLPTGNLYAVIAFARTPISRSTAEVFRTVALKLKAAILPFEGAGIFRDRQGTPHNTVSLGNEARMQVLQSKVAALEELEGVYDCMVIEQSERLENLVSQVKAANTTLQREIEQRKEAEADRERVQRRFMDASRKAGMAEIAIGVLHNVGNALNSLNVSASLLSERLRKSKNSDFKAAIDMINEHASDLGGFFTTDDRGQHALPYLTKLADVWKSETEKMLDDVKSLTVNVDHIKTIVAAQQSYATLGGVIENVDVSEVVDDALKMEGESFSRHRIEVVREVEQVRSLRLDKQKLVQIVVNLIKNAKEAILESTNQQRRLTVRIAQENASVVIEIIDTGVGIAPQNLSKIFAHGYTSKKTGHGFGLHHSALSAREMDGRLSVASDGVGKGATFRLELPVVPPASDR